MSRRGNGEGTIYYSEKLKKWIAQFYVEGDPVRKSRYGNTRKEVKEKMLDAQSKAKNGNFVNNNDITLGEIIRNQLESKLNNNIITERTYKRTDESIDIIKRNNKHILDYKIQKITEKQLQDFLTPLTKYSNSTINQIFQLISRAYDFAYKNKIISSNPFYTDKIIKPKSSKQTKLVEALTVDEQKKLLDVFSNEEKDSKYKLIILLMLYTGMRIGEVLALKKEDIDFKNGYIYIHRTVTRDKNDKIILSNKTKTFDKNNAANRNFKMTDIVADILRTQLNNNIDNIYNLVFYDNGIIDPTNVNSYLYRINKKYQIAEHMHNHMFRHTYATRKIEGGMSAVVLQKKLGHAKIETTLNVYASVFDKFEDNQDEKCYKYESEEGLIINL